MSETGWTKVPNAIARSSTLSPAAKCVYLVIASRAGADGTCWPSIATIAGESGASDSTVKRALVELKSSGWLAWQTRRGDDGKTKISNLYELTTPARDHGSDRPMDGSQGPMDGSQGPYPQVTLTPPIGHSDPIRRPIEEDPLKKSASAPHVADRFDEFWAVYPIRKGKKPAETAWAKALKKTDADTIIDGAKSYAEQVRRTGAQHVKWPQGWLNDERWTDEPDRPSLVLVPGDSAPVIYDQWRLR